jgi:hypothetical protein
VNVTAGEYDPSVITTLFAPTGDGGTWEVHTIPPEAFVVPVQSVSDPSQTTPADADPANPDPVTVMDAPTSPEVGATPTAGSTVNGASAEFVFSAAVTV